MKKPEIVEKYWYSIDWDVGKLWSLELTVVELKIDNLIWHLDVPIWPDNMGIPYSVTPRQVIDEPTKYLKEYRRIKRSDLHYPLEIYKNKDRIMILDGVHRFTKAWYKGHEKIRARWIPETEIIKLNG